MIHLVSQLIRPLLEIHVYVTLKKSINPFSLSWRAVDNIWFDQGTGEKGFQENFLESFSFFDHL
jgi:hypothetical protein